MAITNLSGTTWLIPITVSFEDDRPFHGASINFTANSTSYAYLDVGDSHDSTIFYGASAQSTIEVYDSTTGWIDSAYRKVSISGGDDATDPYVINWFVAQCTDITPNVVLKDENYTEQTYNGVQTVSLPNTAGGTTKYSIRPSAELEILQDGVYDTSAFGSVKVSGAGGAVITGATDVTVKALENITQGDTLYIYKDLQALFNPNTPPASAGYGCSFSPDGTRLAVGHSTSPNITIYDTTTTLYTKLTNPGTLPAGTGYGCAFSPDGTRLAVAFGNYPYITTFNTSGQIQASKGLNKSGISIGCYGYAKSSIASGSTGTAAVLFEP